MSGSDEGGRPDLAAHRRLQSVVERLLEQLRQERLRGDRADLRIRELESLLARFARGDEDPVRLARQVTGLEEERDRLLDRLREGREGVQRVLAQIRFLESRAESRPPAKEEVG